MDSFLTSAAAGDKSDAADHGSSATLRCELMVNIYYPVRPKDSILSNIPSRFDGQSAVASLQLVSQNTKLDTSINSVIDFVEFYNLNVNECLCQFPLQRRYRFYWR